ncbi:unnamed protein product [Closterium sp. Naga37s-1]|nr:unnamed protein product [Closterium sp. Naga37s-1]
MTNVTLTRPTTNAPPTPLPPPDLSELAGLPDGMQRLVLIDRTLQDNPPAQDQANLEALSQLAGIGISPSAPPFSPAALSPLQSTALAQAYALANVTIRGAYALMLLGVNRSVVVNRWLADTSLGYYGDRFLFRAAFSSTGGLGALPASESLYFFTWQGPFGLRYDGSSANYSLHLSPPPVTACGFWSLTVYNADGFLPPGMWRNSIGDRTKGLVFNPDGTLTVPIQLAAPANASLGANWLPTPNATFSVALRVYCPSESVLNGEWRPEAVQVV